MIGLKGSKKGEKRQKTMRNDRENGRPYTSKTDANIQSVVQFIHKNHYLRIRVFIYLMKYSTEFALNIQNEKSWTLQQDNAPAQSAFSVEAFFSEAHTTSGGSSTILTLRSRLWLLFISKSRIVGKGNKLSEDKIKSDDDSQQTDREEGYPALFCTMVNSDSLLQGSPKGVYSCWRIEGCNSWRIKNFMTSAQFFNS